MATAAVAAIKNIVCSIVIPPCLLTATSHVEFTILLQILFKPLNTIPLLDKLMSSPIKTARHDTVTPTARHLLPITSSRHHPRLLRLLALQ